MKYSSVNRLPEPYGVLLDRNVSIEFEFDGQKFQGFQGDTLASALIANGRWVMSRSFKYHRPRAPLSMAGQDANTLIQLPQEANVLADMLQITPNLHAKGQNYTGSLLQDSDALLGHFSKFMPVGFYYRSFYKPKGVWKLWEPMIRKKAGLGVVDLNFEPEYYDKAYLFTDIAVVGAGPAGLKAALTAAEAGLNVLLVEQEQILGGSLNYARFDQAGKLASTLRAQLVSAVESHAKITLLKQATCNAWFSDHYLAVIQDKRLYKVRAQQCIVATGSFDQPVVFRHNDLPGIVLMSALQRLIKLYGVRAGQKIVILTGHDDGYLAALDCIEAGMQVTALVDMRSGAADPALQQALQQYAIPCYFNSTVYEALHVKGGTHIRGVDVRQIVAEGQVSEHAHYLKCDVVAMSSGYMPVYQLLCQAGAKLHYQQASAQFSISDLTHGLYVAGAAHGVHSIANVLQDAAHAAKQAIAKNYHLDTLDPIVFNEAPLNYPWPIFAHPQGKEFVDYDEDLQVKDIIHATQSGYRDIQLVKRFSTVGMGPSQGRHSALTTARLVAKYTQRSMTETGVTTARPPFSAEKLAHLAGRRFDPYRQTAMHRRHLELGASMMPVGNWQRPAFYGSPEQRLQHIQAEVHNVRHNVGIIDVSTLGGLDIRGPDSAELLNRIYTFSFSKLAVGKTRYAVMAAEDGVIMDDGVAARLGEQHFYVTATTSAVDRVYQQMLKWNAQWRLNVDIANVTSAFCAVNIAGPNAAKLMQQICHDVDFSQACFPYLGVRLGTIQDIPVRLLRVGFVGELGYEIHYPARYGEFLWDVLLNFGQAFHMQPFGVEAQRLLRLEKGHLIVGQDTDGMSHPLECDLAWAVAKSKPWFVGKRSISILSQQPLKRKLVCFCLDKQQSKPLEGHIVLSGDKITGHVTSCEFSAILDQTIGMAYVGVEQSQEGDQFPIRVEKGEIVYATVVKAPFYDPEARRQEMMI